MGVGDDTFLLALAGLVAADGLCVVHDLCQPVQMPMCFGCMLCALMVACVSRTGLQEGGQVKIVQCGIEHDRAESSTGRLTSVLRSSKSVQRSDPQKHVCLKSLFVEFEANNEVTFNVIRLRLQEIPHMVDVLTIKPVC